MPKKPVRVADIEEVSAKAPEVFEPAPLPAAEEPRTERIVLYVSIGASAVLLCFAFYAIFFMSAKKPAPAPIVMTAPAPLPPVAPPPPPAPLAPLEIEPATTQAAPPPPPPPPSWANLKPVRPPMPVDAALTDESVGTSIQHGVDYLISHIVANEITEGYANHETFEGANALCLYALLHAGNAIDDPRLGIANPLIQGMLEQVKKFEMDQDEATYCRSIRASALALFDRPQDRSALRKDLEWLTASATQGHYTYGMPPKGAKPEQVPWDNSNSQYGMLGVWAASEAGIHTSDGYWNNITQHWLSTEHDDGGWGYQPGDGSTTTMTCAGITSLCVASEQGALITAKGEHDPNPRLTNALLRGAFWLGEKDRLLNMGHYEGYGLYGVERAGLATGYKWFGPHNWYRELAAQEIQNQLPDGSWDGASGKTVQTSFRLLFLARGRQPLLMNKLRFNGNWNNRPRDASKLVEFGTAELEHPFAWGIADLDRNWGDWIDCPLLFISTDTPPNWSNEDYAKLRAFTDAGGLIFLHNDWGSPEMDAFAADFARRAFPEMPLAPLPDNHPVYSAVFPLKSHPVLQGVSNGDRLLLIYSHTDITQPWVTRQSKQSNVESQLGLNICVYAAGLDGFRRRLNTPFIPEPAFKPQGEIPILRVKYPGNWDPEPQAWVRFPRWFQNQTSVGLSVAPTELRDLKISAAPIAVLTGNTAVDFDHVDLTPLHDFVADGGVLLIDSVAGSPAFIRSVRDQLLPKAFPQAQAVPLAATDPILLGVDPCMDPLPKPRLRHFAVEQLNGNPPILDSLTIGKGTIIISDLDITAGLLDSGGWGINGYTPTYCQSLVKNVILWSLRRYHS